MFRPFSVLFGSAAVAVVVSLASPLEARGGTLIGPGKRGAALQSPIDCPDVPGHFDRQGTFYPYYSPIVPVSCRWRIVRLTPYYPGYCASNGRGSSGCCYGDGLYGFAGEGSADYGPYSGAPRDEAYLLHLGGGGPGDGAVRSGPADLMDAVPSRR